MVRQVCYLEHLDPIDVCIAYFLESPAELAIYLLARVIEFESAPVSTVLRNQPIRYASKQVSVDIS